MTTVILILALVSIIMVGMWIDLYVAVRAIRRNTEAIARHVTYQQPPMR